MPAYKDNSGKWYCKFYYSDGTGKRRAKLKRGFTLRREAEAWERAFLEQKQFQPNMPFREFFALYRAEIDPQIRLNSRIAKDYKSKRILPYFGDMGISDITPADVRKWHNELIEQGFSKKYIVNLHRELSAVFNHAIRFYGLKENPARIATLPKVPGYVPQKMRYLTLSEFQRVIEYVDDMRARVAISLLYWSGMRKGELYALTWGKVDFRLKEITVDRSRQRIGRNDILTATKTYEARTLRMPEQVMDDLKEYKNTCYSSSDDDYLFPFDNQFIPNAIRDATEKANEAIEDENREKGTHVPPITRIHVHGLRHSHASYLISIGVNIVLVSKRLGHEKVSTTLDTYSHFFPKDERDMLSTMNNDAKRDG